MIIPVIILLLFCLCLAIYTVFMVGSILVLLPIVTTRVIYLWFALAYKDTTQYVHESIPFIIHLIEVSYQNTTILDDIAVPSPRHCG